MGWRARLPSLSVAVRIFLAPGLIGLMLLLVLAIASWQGQRHAELQSETLDRLLPTIQRAEALVARAADAQSALYQAIVWKTIQQPDDRIAASIDRAKALLDAIELDIAALKQSGVVDGAIGQVEERFAAYRRNTGNAMLMATRNASQAGSMMLSVSTQYAGLSEQLAALTNGLQAQAARQQADAGADRSMVQAGLVILAIGSILGALAITVGIGRSVARPIASLTRAMQRLAAGERSLSSGLGQRRDELGDMARALDIFAAALTDNDRRREAELSAAAAKAERAHRLQQEIESFDQQMRDLLGQFGAATETVLRSAEAISAAVTDASTDTRQVVSDSDEVSNRTSLVAAATEQMNASINEISRSTEHTASTSRDAVARMERAVASLGTLTQAAEQIGSTVGLIDSIAGQTNLLALNATIEAARAGEAGKGFAVGAGEVKQLAGQTSRATEDIARLVSGIQGAATQVAGALDEVQGVVRAIDEAIAMIASAIAEQRATTEDISGNIVKAAANTRMVTERMARVMQATSDIEAASSLAQSDLNQLSTQFDGLQTRIEGFTQRVAAL